MIWMEVTDELRAKEQEEILRKRIFLRRLPSEWDRSINRSTDTLECVLSNSDLDPDYRASLASSCSKTITQFKFDMMAIHLNALQSSNRAHHSKLQELKET